MLNDLLKEYRELEETARPLNDKLRSVKLSIRDVMTAKGLGACRFEGVAVVRYSTTKTTYPKALIEKHLDSKQKALVSKIVTSEGLRITLNGK